MRWFDEVFDAAKPLRDAVIADYERKWKVLRKQAKTLCDEQRKLEDAFAHKAAAVMRHWDDAVIAAKEYMKTAGYQHTYDTRKIGGDRIKQSLRYPMFDFDANGWDGFYSPRMDKVPC